jgi:hypothetical protein
MGNRYDTARIGAFGDGMFSFAATLLVRGLKLRPRGTLIIALALAAVALVATGCGSSKPDYCSNVSDLKESVDELGSIQVESGVLSTVRSDLEEVRANANTVVSSVKQDFPNETSALKSSVSSLSDTVNQLPPTPTPKQLVDLTAEIATAVTAAEELSSATESACE